MQQIQWKSNRWSLCLSLSRQPSKVIQTPRRSYWSQLAACGGEFFSKATVVQTKMGHVSKTTPFRGNFSSILARLDIASLCTKFESSIFSDSWDMDGAPNILNVSRDVTTPLSGTVWRPSAGTIVTVNMYTKYESLWLLTTKIWKATKKCKNEVVWEVRGHPRSSETSPFDRAHMTSYSTLIETMRLSFTVFEL